MEKTELLKEIEQLKLNASPSEIAVWERMNKAEALNAELLDALKVAKEHWNAPVQRKLQVMIDKQIESAIAKAEGKQIKIAMSARKEYFENLTQK